MMEMNKMKKLKTRMPNQARSPQSLLRLFMTPWVIGWIVFAHAAASAADTTLADFEDKEPTAANFTTHKAKSSAVGDVPEGGGRFAAKTVVDTDAGASGYFGTGFPIPTTDLSTANMIRFWIKTDIESDFNFQIHSDENLVSAFRFSTARSAGEWQQITAPVMSFQVPQWSAGKVDWSAVIKWQVTAFGNGPYDGKSIILDNVVSVGKRDSTKPSVRNGGPVQRGGPIHVKHAEAPSKPISPPEGFRSLFDGKTLAGWKAMARIPVAKYPDAEFKWRLEGDALKEALKNTGRWIVRDGAIVGGQDPPGSGKGAYLVSEEKFGDFELIMDMKPDWKTDSGFLVRTLPGGSPGMQILVDHRPQGGIGGFYGNGVAGIHGMPFAIDAEYDSKGNPIRMIAADVNDERVELSKKTREILKHGANVDDFLKVWKWGEWNTVKVRCEGRIPTITTWVNGLKIAVLEMNDLEWENYDKEACAKMLGRKGHISLEVHNNNFNHWLGKDRWWPGAVVRWKNIYIRELEPEEANDDR
jgi:3-keto-disaccharide hydrolase